MGSRWQLVPLLILHWLAYWSEAPNKDRSLTPVGATTSERTPHWCQNEAKSTGNHTATRITVRCRDTFKRCDEVFIRSDFPFGAFAPERSPYSVNDKVGTPGNLCGLGGSVPFAWYGLQRIDALFRRIRLSPFGTISLAVQPFPRF